MTMNRAAIQRTNLVQGKDFSIDEIIKNDYTHYLQLSHLPSEDILEIIPFDPADCSVLGSISKEVCKKLSDPESGFKLLSETLISRMGSNELMLIPDEYVLPNYTSPELDEKSVRLRHADRAKLFADTAEVLRPYQNLVKELDNQYKFVADEKSIVADHDVNKRYQEINNILEQARFTKKKMEEYKNEQLQGKISRFKNEFIRPMALLDKKTNLSGLIRATLMGNKFVYLSDEVMNQNIVPLSKFPGVTADEQNENREVFLLAYLINKACKVALEDQSHVFIIAAKDREKLYEAIGFKNFPIKIPGWKAVVNFSPPGPVVQQAQQKIKELVLPKSEVKENNTKSNILHYAGYVGAGAAVVGLGFFALRMLTKGETPAPEIITKFKP